MDAMTTETEILSLFVPGKPYAQGSKRHVGGGVMVESNKKLLMPWRQSIAVEANYRWQEPLIQGAVAATYIFCFARPRSHYGTGRNAGLVKANAPTHHTQKPDVEKLVRAVNDALTGVVWKDDSQVTECFALKRWTTGTEGLELILRRLETPASQE